MARKNASRFKFFFEIFLFNVCFRKVLIFPFGFAIIIKYYLFKENKYVSFCKGNANQGA